MLGIKDTSGAGDAGGTQKGTETHDDSGDPPPPTSGKITIPEGWERVDKNSINALKDYTNAEDIATDYALLLQGNEYTLTSNDFTVTPNDIVPDLIKYNSSIFNEDGTVKENADWSKPALPNKEWIIENRYY